MIQFPRFQENILNIYFSCSITGGRNQQQIYAEVVKFLMDEGHDVPTAHLASVDVIDKEITEDAPTVYKRDIGWVRDCDALVAEVSTPSHGVGYEIAAALYEGKPVLCCYEKSHTVSKMILGNNESEIQVFGYSSIKDLKNEIMRFLSKLG